MGVNLIITFVVCVLSAIALRVFILLYKIFTEDCQFISKHDRIRTLICIGSGGHTTEMLRLMKHFNAEKFSPRLYVMADNDTTSEVKINKFEISHTNFYRIPRSRNVNQSYLTSMFSTLYATLYTIPAIYKFKPSVIFCNGPGTCIPVCLISFLFRCLFILDCRIIFIESLCRVRSLSLSGKILQFFADVFIIQWPQLRHCCIRAKYFGRLT